MTNKCAFSGLPISSQASLRCSSATRTPRCSIPYHDSRSFVNPTHRPKAASYRFSPNETSCRREIPQDSPECIHKTLTSSTSPQKFINYNCTEAK